MSVPFTVLLAWALFKLFILWNRWFSMHVLALTNYQSDSSPYNKLKIENAKMLLYDQFNRHSNQIDKQKTVCTQWNKEFETFLLVTALFYVVLVLSANYGMQSLSTLNLKAFKDFTVFHWALLKRAVILKLCQCQR